MIEHFLPSEIAKLVLGYLIEENFYQTKECFMRECIYLTEFICLSQSGHILSTNITGKSLQIILQEYSQLINNDCNEKYIHKHKNFNNVSLIHRNKNMIYQTKQVSESDILKMQNGLILTNNNTVYDKKIECRLSNDRKSNSKRFKYSDEKDEVNSSSEFVSILNTSIIRPHINLNSSIISTSSLPDNFKFKGNEPLTINNRNVIYSKITDNLLSHKSYLKTFDKNLNEHFDKENYMNSRLKENNASTDSGIQTLKSPINKSYQDKRKKKKPFKKVVTTVALIKPTINKQKTFVEFADKLSNYDSFVSKVVENINTLTRIDDYDSQDSATLQDLFFSPNKIDQQQSQESQHNINNKASNINIIQDLSDEAIMNIVNQLCIDPIMDKFLKEFELENGFKDEHLFSDKDSIINLSACKKVSCSLKHDQTETTISEITASSFLNDITINNSLGLNHTSFLANINNMEDTYGSLLNSSHLIDYTSQISRLSYPCVPSNEILNESIIECNNLNTLQNEYNASDDNRMKDFDLRIKNNSQFDKVNFENMIHIDSKVDKILESNINTMNEFSEINTGSPKLNNNEGRKSIVKQPLLFDEIKSMQNIISFEIVRGEDNRYNCIEVRFSADNGKPDQIERMKFVGYEYDGQIPKLKCHDNISDNLFILNDSNANKPISSTPLISYTSLNEKTQSNNLNLTAVANLSYLYPSIRKSPKGNMANSIDTDKVSTNVQKYKKINTLPSNNKVLKSAKSLAKNWINFNSTIEDSDLETISINSIAANCMPKLLKSTLSKDSKICQNQIDLSQKSLDSLKLSSNNNINLKTCLFNNHDTNDKIVNNKSENVKKKFKKIKHEIKNGDPSLDISFRTKYKRCSLNDKKVIDLSNLEFVLKSKSLNTSNRIENYESNISEQIKRKFHKRSLTKKTKEEQDENIDIYSKKQGFNKELVTNDDFGETLDLVNLKIGIDKDGQVTEQIKKNKLVMDMNTNNISENNFFKNTQESKICISPLSNFNKTMNSNCIKTENVYDHINTDKNSMISENMTKLIDNRIKYNKIVCNTQNIVSSNSNYNMLEINNTNFKASSFHSNLTFLKTSVSANNLMTSKIKLHTSDNNASTMSSKKSIITSSNIISQSVNNLNITNQQATSDLPLNLILSSKKPHSELQFMSNLSVQNCTVDQMRFFEVSAKSNFNENGLNTDGLWTSNLCTLPKIANLTPKIDINSFLSKLYQS